jgi:hypothetical protein
MQLKGWWLRKLSKTERIVEFLRATPRPNAHERGPRQAREILDAAHATARVTAEAAHAPAGQEAFHTCRTERHVEFDALIVSAPGEFGHIVRGIDDPFGHAETDREIYKIGRRGHHHGIGKTSVNDADWDFRRNTRVPFRILHLVTQEDSFSVPPTS